MTTHVPDLSLHNLRTSTLSTRHNRWSFYLLSYKEGRSVTVPVLRCLETKEMQRVSVQCSGSRFPSLVPRVSFLDGYTICFCRQGLYHHPPVTDTVHATKQPCRGSPRHYISRVLVTSSFLQRSQVREQSSVNSGHCRLAFLQHLDYSPRL